MFNASLHFLLTMSDRVVCRSEFTYAERPLTLLWQGKRLMVQTILQRWRLPSGVRFWVRADDDRSYELDYSDVNDEWHIYPL